MRHDMRDPTHRFACTLTVALALLLVGGCTTTTTTDAPATDWFDGGPMKAASPETLQLTARVLASKGNTEQAGFLIDRMARDYPDNLGTYTEGAEVLLIQGRVREATEWLERGLARFPNNPILRNDRGMCRLLEANLPAATADFEAAYATDPEMRITWRIWPWSAPSQATPKRHEPCGPGSSVMRRSITTLRRRRRRHPNSSAPGSYG